MFRHILVVGKINFRRIPSGGMSGFRIKQDSPEVRPYSSFNILRLLQVNHPQGVIEDEQKFLHSIRDLENEWVEFEEKKVQKNSSGLATASAAALIEKYKMVQVKMNQKWVKSAEEMNRWMRMTRPTRKEDNHPYWNERNKKKAKEIGMNTLRVIWEIIVAFGKAAIPRRFRYKNVQGQIVLITGAGSGIGRLMARAFALEHRAIVVCWDIDEETNSATTFEIKRSGGKCHAYTVDVANRESVYKAAEDVKREIGKVDILINNAGLVSGKRFLEIPDQDLVKLFRVNTMANFWLAKAFLPGMIQTGRGHIVTISSLAGLVGINQLVDYSSSKYAAVGFHEALTNELHNDEETKTISTTLVCPYYIHTGMFDGVESKLIPILRPQAVADNIVSGILADKETIIIPFYLYLLVLLKNMVPAEVGRIIMTKLGIPSTMTHFRGRGKSSGHHGLPQ